MRLDGARGTADVNLRKVGLFLDRAGLSFEEALSRSRDEPARFRDTLVAFATEEEDRGALSSYTRKVFVGIRSLLRFHEIPCSNFPKPKKTDGASIAYSRWAGSNSRERSVTHFSRAEGARLSRSPSSGAP